MAQPVAPSTQAPAPASPWGKVAAPAPTCSLQEVMSEELIKTIQKDETKTTDPELLAAEAAAGDVTEGLYDASDTSSDRLLAELLQHEYDKQSDANLARVEAKYNQGSKDQDEDFEDEFTEEGWSDNDAEESTPSFSRSGLAKQGNQVVSKHDATICGRRNTKKVMQELPTHLDTGDCRGLDLKLDNKVYNALKRHSGAELKKKARLHDKNEIATRSQAFDEKTRLLLYKLVNNEVLESVDGIIAAGKEAVVLYGTGGRMTEQLVPAECAVKVFRTTLMEFKNRCQYVKGDTRFFKDHLKKQNPRRIMRIWAEKEECNLRKLEGLGLKVPRVVVRKKHVLVMEFLGKDGTPAPQLRDARLDTAGLELAYQQFREGVKRMYRGGLVHADLSPYNLLWHDDQLYVIDTAQAVEVLHPLAKEFLIRDLKTCCEYFSGAGVKDVTSPYDLFNEITGLNLSGEGNEFLSQIEEYEKNEDLSKRAETKTEYPFEFFFNRAQQERLQKDEGQSSGEDSD